jgi:uncharacterized LabA/DUF88 family protein
VASVIAYIDGFNLYHGLRDRYRHKYLWLNLDALVRRLRPHDEILAVRYFTAAVLHDPPALVRQQTYLAALSVHARMVEIIQGRYQVKLATCRTCGASRRHYEEKETDVNIAVSLVADAATASSDVALLISADSDLCPAVRTARRLAPELRICAFPPRRSSFEIRSLIPGAFTLAAADLRNSLLPTTVIDPVTGVKHVRPAKWY